MSDKKLITEQVKLEETSPLVTVFTMAYNHESFIRNCIEGVLMQKTNFPIELIIHDDASTDSTAKIIKEYESKYSPTIKAIYQNENQYSQKINISKKFIYPHIKGKYVAICEGDDYWVDPLKLQKQVDFLEQNEDYGLIYTEIDRVNEKGSIIDRRFFERKSAFLCKTFEDYLIHAPFIAPCTWLFRKSLYKERAKRYVVGDFPMLLDIILSSKIFHLKDTTAHYRVLTNSASHFTDLSKSYSFMKGIFEIQMDYARKYNVSADIIDKIQTKFAWNSYNFAVAENDKKQIKTANKLLIDHPELSNKFLVMKLLAKTRLGRLLVRKRLIRILGYTR